MFFTGIIDIKAAAGDLITAFDGDGIVVYNPVLVMILPTPLPLIPAVFVVGLDEAIALGNPQWRIEKDQLQQAL